MLAYLLLGTMHSGMVGVLGNIAGMEVADARKAVRIWKIASCHNALDPLVFMIFFA